MHQQFHTRYTRQSVALGRWLPADETATRGMFRRGRVRESIRRHLLFGIHKLAATRR